MTEYHRGLSPIRELNIALGNLQTLEISTPIDMRKSLVATGSDTYIRAEHINTAPELVALPLTLTCFETDIQNASRIVHWLAFEDDLR